MTDCIFCRIIAGDIPAKIVAESPDAVAFRDMAPQAPTHVLVVPKAHVSSLESASDPAMLGALLQLAAEVARSEGVEKGYRTVINTGPAAGQTVHHLHAHVLGGRDFDWPPG